jgi:23S rRNA (cytosine1962-C5)-methyltransferase
MSCLEARRARLPAGTTCFRWLDGELPGVTVDRFDDVAVLSFYRPAPGDEVQRLGEALARVGALRAVYVKHRPREARRTGAGPLDALAPAAPVVGAPVDALETQELATRFLIRPGNGLSVGLYLDARAARAFVLAEARGRRVLNLFAYTCGFGLAALRGGAARAVNVDASRKVLDWGEDNLRRNGLPVDRYDFIAGDAFEWLARLAKKEERFDLVVLDPPGFATTKSSRFSAQRDYHQLAAAASRLVAPGGLLLAMCNVEALRLADFAAQLSRGLAARLARQVKVFGASDVDFAQPSALKCLVYELR